MIECTEKSGKISRVIFGKEWCVLERQVHSQVTAEWVVLGTDLCTTDLIVKNRVKLESRQFKKGFRRTHEKYLNMKCIRTSLKIRTSWDFGNHAKISLRTKFTYFVVLA